MVPTLIPPATRTQIQNIAYTGTHALGTPIAAVDSRQYVNVRILSTTDCYYVFGGPGDVAVTATTGVYLTGLLPEYILVPVGSIPDALQVASSGTLQVVPMRDVTV